ncbi:BofC C-terminal domain-containing protein [Paenibacillus sp. GCM10012307]|uniref:BofC C-terminal domain-containing protein n=1 Tax=Paenibacillus roseus TaxID=2798579 RepID=A0A934J725_9BACL|nr:BofC C-terminal domain-containing protein [Paenibacillus roseus]MBJ6362944.1 BofC C-terminal domain-containing protein [Paenibacillus roseus]
MMEFSLWKKLKRRLRKRRKPLWTLGGILIMLLPLLAAPQASTAAELRMEDYNYAPASLIEALQNQHEELEVLLKKEYVCGEEFSQLGRMNVRSIIELLGKHPAWTAHLNGQAQVVMVEYIQDLSDACKQHAFMSLDKDGNLSLFDGPPAKEKVMRTFFQLDMSYMESSLPKEQVQALADGIKINDLDDYNSMLSAYSEFAVREPASRGAMKRSY